ncbi:MAG: DUF1428 domain-containing protein [Azospirillaceae bacterium]
MAYVDAYAAAVPNANRAAYVRMTETSREIFTANGALQVIECWGDDVPEGTLTSFPLAVKCGPDETVVVGWVVWPSKAVRDAGNEKAMADPRFTAASMPFDGKRMIFGGFEVISGL